MPYPAALGQRPLEVREAYAALEQYAADYGREPLLLLMHAAVAETLRADLLNLIRVNFLPGRSADLSLEADVLFSPLSTSLGGGYYRIDAQVRWHCLALLRSLHRDDVRPRELRVAELLWRYVQAMERRASRAGDPRLAEFLAIQRWVALAFLEPASAAHAFAEALRQAGEAPAAALLRLGGVTSAIEMPLASEQTLLAYARAMEALVSGDDERAQILVQALGEHEIRVGGVVLKPATALWAQRQRQPAGAVAAGPGEEASRRKTCFVLIGAAKRDDGNRERRRDLDESYALIRDAVSDLEMDCLRPDELRAPDDTRRAIYEQLLDADLVVCDLSAHDPGIAYLLGVCWALRPSGTLVIAEQGYGRVSGALSIDGLLLYETQGAGLAVEERARFGERLRAIIAEPDSVQLRSAVLVEGALIPPERSGGDAAAERSAAAVLPARQAGKLRCLVLQGFGRRIDPDTGRTLDLDAAYAMIRAAVDGAGLECVRFEFVEPPSFNDGERLRQIHEAELVIADVSAGVESVLLELGIRLALCPSGTLVVADEQCRIPFVLAELRIVRYHLGDDVGSRRAARLRSELGQGIKEALATHAVDSPVYLALPTLRPPRRVIVRPGEEKPPWASAMGSDEYGRYAEMTVAGVSQRFRWIEPGTFLMGSPASEPERYVEEVQHPVTLSRGYWLADTACTQAFWQAVTGANPSGFEDDPRNPVDNVSWDDVQTFIVDLDRRLPGLQARLPSEAEWEYACRAGTTTPFSFGDHITPEQVNYDGDYPYAGGKKGLNRRRTVPVGSLPANRWGLYEMHGNVWEWCADWYGPYPTGEQVDPQGPPEGDDRVLRGGSWHDNGRYVRSANRNRGGPVLRYGIFGFRLALGQQGPAEPA